MKKIGIVLLIGLSLASCQREDIPEPSPLHNNPTVSISSLDSCLSENWKLTKVEVYYQDTLVNALTQTFTDTVHCHMWLKLDPYGSNQPANHYQCIGALGSCVDNLYQWYTDGNFLKGQGSQWIVSLNSTNLILMDSTADIHLSQKNRYYYRR